MASFDILDALVFPDDPSTPTSPGFFPPSGSVDQATTTASSSAAAPDDYPTFASQHDPWAAYPTGDYADYDGGLYGGGMMGLDLGGTSVGGPSGSSTGGGGIELMDIAPLPEFKHSLPLNHPYHTSNVPFCPSSQAYAAQDDYASPHSQTRPPTVSDEDPSPSPSSHYDSLPRTPPSLLNDPHAIASSSSSSNKRARRESSLNPYASTSAGSSYDGSPEPESMRVLGEDDELDFLMHESGDSKGGGAGANGKGKKRKQLPTTAEFQHPDVSGLSKKEARLVKNRAAAFLSRQRKREQFDELEIQCKGLITENQQLKSLLASKASSAPIPTPPAATPKNKRAAAAAAALAPIVTDTSAQVASLQGDLTNLRNLLHASTAREAALEVELASVRAQLGGGTPGATQAVPKAAGAVSPMLSGGMLEAEAAEVIQEMGVAAGGRRSMVAKRDREGKRVGGVALMVILFSFALFTLPPGTISSLPLRASTPTASSFPSSFLGRVLQPGASFPALIDRRPRTATEEDDQEVDMGVCEMDARANGTDSAAANQQECLARQQEQKKTHPSATRAASPSPDANALSHWSLPSAAAAQDRRSFSLTLLRPIPSSPASLGLTGTSATDGVEDVLERWLGLSLFDGSIDNGPRPVGGQQPGGEDDEPGWFVVDTTSPTPAVAEDAPEEVAAKAWDGTPLERMELDEVVFGSEGSKTPQPSSYLTLPSSEATTPTASSANDGLGANDTFVRLDLELEVGVKRREVAIVGREEVGRMMLLGGKGAMGLGGLPGGWVGA